jgi:hypothetical protein
VGCRVGNDGGSWVVTECAVAQRLGKLCEVVARDVEDLELVEVPELVGELHNPARRDLGFGIIGFGVWGLGFGV